MKVSQRKAPVYLRIAGKLRERIANATWRPDHRIPTLKMLMTEFGVARATIRQALDVLEGEGLIFRQRGSGTYVRQNLRSPQVVLKFETSLENYASAVVTGNPILIETRSTYELPDFFPIEKRNVKRFQYVHQICRFDNYAFVREQHYIERSLFKKVERQLSKDHVLVLLAALGELPLDSMEQLFEIGRADYETARLLDIPLNAPIGRLVRLVFNNTRQVIYGAEALYRGESLKFAITFQKNKTAIQNLFFGG